LFGGSNARSILSEVVRSVAGMEIEPAVVPAAISVGAQLTRALDDAGELPVLGLDPAEVGVAIEVQLALIDRLHAQLAVLIEHAGLLGVPAELGAPSMVAWLRGRFALSSTAASQLVRAAAGLAAAPVAARAARIGGVGVEAAAEIGHAVAALPPDLGPQLRAEGEQVLLSYAVGRDGPALDAGQIRFIGRHLHEIVDPEEAERLLADRLAREDAAVHRRRCLSIIDDPCGGVRLRGLLTTEAGALLRAVLDPLSAPRPATGTPARGTVAAPPDESSGGSMSASAPPESNPDAAGVAAADATVPDERTPRQRRADALAEACERLLTHGQLPDTGGERPQLVVTVDYAQLADHLTGDRDARTGRIDGRNERRDPSGDSHRDPRERADSTSDITLDASSSGCTDLGSDVGSDVRSDLGLGVGRLPDGTDLPAATVRRLACDAGIIPAVLGTSGQVLDLGRTARTASPAQRRALALRDGGCCFPGCDRPPGWCDAHHIRHWKQLGATDLDNLVLLCSYHHRVLHDGGWEVQPVADGSRPLFLPPAWIDPDRRSRRNQLHHVRNLLRAPT
jgi:hypothetical protein